MNNEHASRELDNLLTTEIALKTAKKCNES